MSSTTDGDPQHRVSAGRGEGWAYRSYTDDDRAAALVAYYASGGKLRRTAAQLGIPATTLRKWVRDDVKPVEPRRVLEAGATLDAKLEAYLDRALAVHPSEFPRTSFLDHCRAIVLIADMVVKLREGCQSAAARVAAAVRPEDRPLDLSRASPADVAALRAWLDRLSPPTPPTSEEPD